jgi:hypothetical protein
VNADVDRNDVDLNRISTAHDGAPRFLETLAELLEAALARCERAVVLAIHGWNVVQPSVDVGIGYRPGRHAPSAPPGPTASAEFLRGGLTGCAPRWRPAAIGVSLGARYPARAPENLLQLFSERHTADARPLVQRLAQLGRRCDGVQLELAVPLRWPGPWRTRMIASVVDALPALLGRRPETALMPAARPEPAPGTARTFEFVGPDLCGLAALDRAGARLLLFERDGTLALFTGERIGGEADGTVGGLSLHATADGGRRLRYDGPLLRFPDTTTVRRPGSGDGGRHPPRRALRDRLHPGAPWMCLRVDRRRGGHRGTATAGVRHGRRGPRRLARRNALACGTGRRRQRSAAASARRFRRGLRPSLPRRHAHRGRGGGARRRRSRRARDAAPGDG